MTTIAAPPRFTPDDLLRLPDSGSTELVNGQLVDKNVSLLSSQTEARILKVLSLFADRAEIASVFPQSLGYQCFADDPDNVRKPDCTVVRLERLRTLIDPNPGFMPIAPDLAVEVVSTNDTLKEIDEKVQGYLDAGFPIVWVADPIFRQLFVYSAAEEPRLLSGDQEVRCESALPGFSCKVSELFPPRT